ncbi:dual specificity phosphatase [Indivirus ILV1]|uniref:Dual specificity phosphatase n=1 Tax=Indivirus ILV1 TaxID=1977633 RepID=A0A1V0SCH3_9VIRU|nr:dual specificity phosphatase [Indivirus ILV1]
MIFIGNYMSLSEGILQKYEIDSIIVAANGLEEYINYSPGKRDELFLGLTEEDGEKLEPALMKGTQFMHDKIKHGKKVLVTCRFGMNRSVTIVLCYYMLYLNCTFDQAMQIVKEARPIVSPMERYIIELCEFVKKINDTYVDWKNVDTMHPDDFQRLFDYNIGPFQKNTDKYPGKFKDITPLDDDVIKMRRDKVIPDKSKSTNNRERKDHPISLIEKNEKETFLLLNGYYQIPKPKKSHYDLLQKIELTNKFILDLDVDAIVNTANEALLGGGGMDQLVHTYAGESLKRETMALPNVINNEYSHEYGIKCLTGDAKITSGHNINVDYIIHVVTPYFDKDGNPDKVNHVKSYKSILKYIDGLNIRSLACGPVSTGYYGYPMLEATILGLMTIRNFIEENYDKIDKLYLWIYNETQYKIYDYLLCNMFRSH